MAERIVKIRECDRAGCRNRKGVKEVGLSLNDMDNSDADGNAELLFFVAGELCPAHVKMAKRFMENLFKNTKQYDDPASPIG